MCLVEAEPHNQAPVFVTKFRKLSVKQRALRKKGKQCCPENYCSPILLFFGGELKIEIRLKRQLYILQKKR